MTIELPRPLIGLHFEASTTPRRSVSGTPGPPSAMFRRTFPPAMSYGDDTLARLPERLVKIGD